MPAPVPPPVSEPIPVLTPVPNPVPVPVDITSRRTARCLHLSYEDGTNFDLPHEFLRVLSPSAQVQGHGGVGGELPLNKSEVTISKIDPVGNYGIKITFSDGHDTGIYSWDILYRYGLNQAALWQEYQDKLAKLSV